MRASVCRNCLSHEFILVHEIIDKKGKYNVICSRCGELCFSVEGGQIIPELEKHMLRIVEMKEVNE